MLEKVARDGNSGDGGIFSSEMLSDNVQRHGSRYAIFFFMENRRKAREPSYSPFPTCLNATIPGSGVARSSPMNDSEFQDTPPVIFLFSFDRARFVNGRNLSEVSQDEDKESGGCLVMGTGSWISDHR